MAYYPRTFKAGEGPPEIVALVAALMPRDAPKIEPPELVGGNAQIELVGVPHGAGCVVFVRDGWLAMFEAFTNEGPWPEAAVILGVKEVTPIDPGWWGRGPQ